jgi:hypothetical protein
MDKTRLEADGPQQIWEIIRQKSAEFWNIISSIDSGIFCSERDFNLKVLAPSLQKVIKAYDIMLLAVRRQQQPSLQRIGRNLGLENQTGSSLAHYQS